MAGFNFAPTLPATPSVYDVQRRQDLAKMLQQKSQIPAQNFIGVLASGLAGGLGGYESSQAAQESQQGLDSANAALAQALSGGGNVSSMITAGGNPFLPGSESGLVGDLLRRKLGIGETFFGTPTAATDAQGNVHYYQMGSLGDMHEVKPQDGQSWAPRINWLDTGTGYQAAPTIAGAAPAATPGSPTSITKNNAQAAFDKAAGEATGKIATDAPANLQAENQSVQMLDNHYQTATAAIKDAMGSASAFTTGTLGNVLNAVPGTPAYDLKQRLQTVQAIVGFQTLQDIRNASKTGGGLGQISNFEEQLLQAVNGSLDPGQSPDQFKASLQRVQAVLDQLNQQAHQNYLQDYARLSQAPAAPPTLGAGANPYVTNGSIPAPTASPSMPVQPAQPGGWKILNVQ